MKSRWTIYCHVHIGSGRRYVGLTKKTMMQRWNQHVYTASHISKRGWSYFANAIRKYGKKAFSHEVLEICFTLEEANSAEIKWIDHFDTRNPDKGFNLTKGGNYPNPIRKNPWDDPNFKKKMLDMRDSTLFSIEAKERRRVSNMGKALTPEKHAHMIRIRENQVYSDERLSNMSVVSIELWGDSSFREKVSSSVKKRMNDPDIQAKLSKSSKGRKHSAETRAKIATSMKAKFILRHQNDSVHNSY